MAPNPRVIKALSAMEAIQVSAEEVKPVLVQLLRLYDRNWELIEEDNYRTLKDAYFDFKEEENKVEEGKKKASFSCPAGERSKQKRLLIDEDDEFLSTTDKSSPKLSAEDKSISHASSDKKLTKSSQTNKEDVKPTFSSQTSHPRLRQAEKVPNLPCKAIINRKPYPEKEASSSSVKKLNKPSQTNKEDVKPTLTSQTSHTRLSEAEKAAINRKPYPEKAASASLDRKLTKPCQTIKADVKPPTSSQTSHTRLREAENVSNLPYKATISRKPYPETADSSSSVKKLNKPSQTNKEDVKPTNNSQTSHSRMSEAEKAAINRKPFRAKAASAGDSVDYEKEIVEPRFKKPKLQTQPSSANGLPEASNGNHCVKGSSSNNAGSHNLAFLPQKAVTQVGNFIRDIAKGSEMVQIPLLDESGKEELPKFNYIPQNIIYQSANVNISLARISDEGCCLDCSGNCISSSLPCACARETGGEFAYTPQGVLKEEFINACMSMKNEPQPHHLVYCKECPVEKSKNEYLPDECKGHMVRKFIKECWRKCGCDMQCGNRVVQRGIRRKLQVYLTPDGKGWGLRTLEDLPKGTFVCEYAGEILTNTELYDRNQRIVQNRDNERHTYPVTLDADWGSEEVLADEEALCLDATYNGNVGRFINHRCFDANLIDIPVEVETPDHHYYHLAFFTNRNVKAYEELTWDYGIDFNDVDHPIKAFQCCCGSPFCTDSSDKKRKGKIKIENQVHVTPKLSQLRTS